MATKTKKYFFSWRGSSLGMNFLRARRALWRGRSVFELGALCYDLLCLVPGGSVRCARFTRGVEATLRLDPFALE